MSILPGPIAIHVLLLLCATFVAGSSTASAIGKWEPTPDRVYEGTILAIGDNTLVMKVGEENATIQINKETVVQIDGKDNSFKQLKKGMTARVFAAEQDRKLIAKIIDARTRF